MKPSSVECHFINVSSEPALERSAQRPHRLVAVTDVVAARLDVRQQPHELGFRVQRHERSVVEQEVLGMRLGPAVMVTTLVPHRVLRVVGS